MLSILNHCLAFTIQILVVIDLGQKLRYLGFRPGSRKSTIFSEHGDLRENTVATTDCHMVEMQRSPPKRVRAYVSIARIEINGQQMCRIWILSKNCSSAIRY